MKIQERDFLIQTSLNFPIEEKYCQCVRIENNKIFHRHIFKSHFGPVRWAYAFAFRHPTSKEKKEITRRLCEIVRRKL